MRQSCVTQAFLLQQTLPVKLNRRGFELTPSSKPGRFNLAEATAAGLSCVALDAEIHRGMIVTGETGYLYRTVREMLSHIGQIVDS